MTEQRFMAIDFGEKRIGIAITDPLNIFAYPLVTLNNDSAFLQQLGKLITDYNVVKLILGYPLKESGEESEISKKVLKFKIMLEEKIKLPVELTDERYSSDIAKNRILQTVSSKKKRRDKSLLDKNAASVILEDYLKSISS
jgi:putative holliday junction resolvase